MNEAMKPAPAATVAIGKARFGNDLPFAVMAGPCVLESRAHALEMASALKEIADSLGLGLVYKSSFDKANRTSAGSARGLAFQMSWASARSRVINPTVTAIWVMYFWRSVL